MPLLFSVVIPLYNKQRFVRDAVCSVIAQDHSSFELIVVDDGSTDSSLDEVQAIDTPRIRIIEQENAGPGIARNRGVADASGEWIAFLDADDIWFNNHLAVLERLIRAYPEVNVVCTSFQRGSILERANVPTIKERSDCKLDYFKTTSQRETLWSSTVAIRRQTFCQSGGFGAKYPGEDIEFWARLALDHSIAFSEEVTALYRIDSEGLMAGGSHVTSPDQQPVFATIEKALLNPAYIHCHIDMRVYRRYLMIGGVRQALYNGDSRIAKEYLNKLHMNGDRVPIVYKVLAALPGKFVSISSQAYSLAKQAFIR